jgi:hypothetical protein
MLICRPFHRNTDPTPGQETLDEFGQNVACFWLPQTNPLQQSGIVLFYPILSQVATGQSPNPGKKRDDRSKIVRIFE